MSVRLACVKHAASVHPEPGSNSHVKKFNNLSCFLPVFHWLRSCSFSFLSEFVFASTGFTVLFGSFSNLLISRISFSEFHPELLSASGFCLPLPAASFKKLLFGIYSGLHYCLFVKVLFAVAKLCFACSPQQLCYLITGFLLCQQLF